MKKSKVQKISFFCILPQRYVVCIMAFFGALICFSMKNVLSHTLISLWTAPNATQLYNSTLHLQCPEWAWENSSKQFTFSFTYTESQLHFLELLNGIGYLIPLIPAGYFTDQKGGKRVLISSVFFSSILFIVFPLLLWATNNSVIIAQIFFFCMGAATCLTMPSLASIISQWAPPNELCFMASIVYAGSVVCPVLKIISAEVVRMTKRPNVIFYFYGGLGLTYVLLAQLLLYSSPFSHPFISAKEKKFLIDHLRNYVKFGKKSIPWCKVFRSIAIWATIFGECVLTWNFVLYTESLPSYMQHMLKFEFFASAYWNCVPYVSMSVGSICSGAFFDWIVKKDYLHVTTARKICTDLGNLGPPWFILIATFSGCSRMLAVSFFVVAICLMAFGMIGVRLATQDLCPNFAGSISAMIEFVCCVFSMSMHIFFEKPVNMQMFREMYLTNLVIATCGTFIYVIFGKATIEPWNMLKKTH